MIAFLDLTTVCPCRCKHCYVDKTNFHMPLKKCYQAIEKSWEIGADSILFIGGEPFEYPYLDMAFGRAVDCRLKVYIETSGVGWKYFESLIPKFEKVWVSLDYYGKKHDQWRGRDGVFDSAMELFEKYDNVGIRSVLMNDNVEDVKRLMELCSNKNREWTGVVIKPVNEFARKKLPSSDDLLELYKESLEHGFVIDEPSLYVFASKLFNTKFNAVCNAGEKLFSIKVDGSITPCAFLSKALPEANIFFHDADEIKVRLKEQRKNLLEYMPPLCHDCSMKHECGGCKVGTFVCPVKE